VTCGADTPVRLPVPTFLHTLVISTPERTRGAEEPVLLSPSSEQLTG
jgi:hypothetical protein